MRLNWKPGSLEVLVAGFRPEGAVSMQWRVVSGEGSLEYAVKCVAHIVFLGAFIDSRGDPLALAQFRVCQAWTHFWARRKQFCCRHISLKLRWGRIYQTVLAHCFLFGRDLWF